MPARKTHWMALIAVVCLFSGCTTYKEMGFAGGVQSTQIDGNTFRIEAKGNAFSSTSQIRDYAMMKAAETTLAAGHDYFIIAGSEDTSRTTRVNSNPSATSQTTVSGGVATTQTSYQNLNSNEYFKPGQDLIIKTFKGRKPQDNLAAFDAREVVAFLGPKVKS